MKKRTNIYEVFGRVEERGGTTSLGGTYCYSRVLGKIEIKSDAQLVRWIREFKSGETFEDRREKLAGSILTVKTKKLRI